jgi:hypothetical protein
MTFPCDPAYQVPSGRKGQGGPPGGAQASFLMNANHKRRLATPSPHCLLENRRRLFQSLFLLCHPRHPGTGPKPTPDESSGRRNGSFPAA